MTENRKDALLNLLFSDEGVELVNLKLLRGDAPDVSEDELCGEIHSAIIQTKTGLAETLADFPEDKTHSVNLRDLEEQI